MHINTLTAAVCTRKRPQQYPERATEAHTFHGRAQAGALLPSRSQHPQKPPLANQSPPGQAPEATAAVKAKTAPERFTDSFLRETTLRFVLLTHDVAPDLYLLLPGCSEGARARPARFRVPRKKGAPFGGG